MSHDAPTQPGPQAQLLLARPLEEDLVELAAALGVVGAWAAATGVVRGWQAPFPKHAPASSGLHAKPVWADTSACTTCACSASIF